MPANGTFSAAIAEDEMRPAIMMVTAAADLKKELRSILIFQESEQYLMSLKQYAECLNLCIPQDILEFVILNPSVH